MILNPKPRNSNPWIPNRVTRNAQLVFRSTQLIIRTP
jgi:hypothetical protein